MPPPARWRFVKMGRWFRRIEWNARRSGFVGSEPFELCGGSIAGVAQLRLQLPQGLSAGPYYVGLQIDDAVFRNDRVIWVRPNGGS